MKEKTVFSLHFARIFETSDLRSKVLSLENERKIRFFFAFCSLICTFAPNFVTIKVLNKYIMAKLKGAIEVDTERCKGCQLCIIACPQKVIALANKVNLHGYPYVEAVNEEACVGCASCGIVCPDGCITVYRVKQE